MTSRAATHRPPTNGKLLRLLAELEAKRGDLDATLAVHQVLRELYWKGLPSGLDPAVVTAVICELMPHGAELQRLARRVGVEYDAAIVAGERQHRARFGVSDVLEVNLVALLAEHGGVPFATAYEQLQRAEDRCGVDPSTNRPARLSPELLEQVRAALAPWFAPAVARHTLALAREGLPPTAWSTGARSGATGPQGGEEWALLIGCALHPGEEAAALIAARRELLPRLDEPDRGALLAVLRYARR